MSSSCEEETLHIQEWCWFAPTLRCSRIWCPELVYSLQSGLRPLRTGGLAGPPPWQASWWTSATSTSSPSTCSRGPGVQCHHGHHHPGGGRQIQPETPAVSIIIKVLLVCVCVSVCLSGFLHEIQGFCKLHISCYFSYAAVISDTIYLGKRPPIISYYISQIMY